ncbi:hypothetical protein TEQG_06067 [Trichophyton equinum CBS 127.97]|uniref:Uncharacterized protein n=1 Tax=Trichophyton equinum (strain ATCC MYA-4606 / CBS 127.97) TaxID=559882 RepID=F2PYW0_TRIEC|nr:hypothetical protein TEQG_06067 [Trichophyton equinum CBS 127.97]
MGKDEVGSGLCVPLCPPRWSRAARRLGRFPLLVFGPVSTCVFVSQQEVEAGETGPQSVLISHIPSLPFVRRTVVAAAVKGTVQAGSRQQAATLLIEAGACIRQARRATAIPGLAVVSPRRVQADVLKESQSRSRRLSLWLSDSTTTKEPEFARYLVVIITI